MAKILVLMTVCIFIASTTSAAVLVPEPEASKKYEFSSQAKYLLKEASLRALSFLCFEENVNSEIDAVICRKVILNMNQPVNVDEPLRSNCMDCEVADPICWDACPQ